MNQVLLFRLVSSRAPYGRAGLHFTPAPARVFGVVLVPAATVAPDKLADLFADPFIDVSAGTLEGGFHPIVDALDLARVEQMFEAAREWLAERTANALAGFDSIVDAFHDGVTEAAGPAATAALNALIDDTVDRVRLAAELSRDGGPMGDEEQNTSTAAGAGEEPPASDHIATGSEGDAAAAAPATGEAEVGSGLGEAGASHATEPKGDQVTPPVVATEKPAKPDKPKK